ncbi:MAG: hypothetical protein U1E65_02745 [Myxococcota bacterium]
MVDAGEVPDTPDDFELRGLLRLPQSEVVQAGAGLFALSHTKRVALLRGVLDPSIARSVADGLTDDWMLIADDPPPDLGPRWRWDAATVWVLDSPGLALRAAQRAKGLRPVEKEDILRIFVPSTVPQILDAFDHGPVMGAWTDAGGLAAVAYSILSTERHFHPTVRSLPPFKGKGYGRRVVQAAAGLFELERQRGRTAVPTIRDTNLMMKGGATILGFRALRRRWFA